MHLDLTTTYIGIIALIIFVLAYVVVMIEEFTNLRKSKPVILSAAIIWGLIGFYYKFHEGHDFSTLIGTNVYSTAKTSGGERVSNLAES